MAEAHDAHDVIHVRTSGADVESVTIGARWRTYYDAESLSLALTDVLVSTIPADAPEPSPTKAARARQQDPEDIQAFWDTMRDYREQLDDLQRRAVVGESLVPPSFEVSDERNRMGANYTRGWFSSLGLDPAWLKAASLQEISNTITETLGQHPLWQPDPAAETLARLARTAAEIDLYRSAS